MFEGEKRKVRWGGGVGKSGNKWFIFNTSVCKNRYYYSVPNYENTHFWTSPFFPSCCRSEGWLSYGEFLFIKYA